MIKKELLQAVVLFFNKKKTKYILHFSAYFLLKMRKRKHKILLKFFLKIRIGKEKKRIRIKESDANGLAYMNGIRKKCTRERKKLCKF